MSLTKKQKHNLRQADLFDNEIDLDLHIEDLLPLEEIEMEAQNQGQVPFYVFKDVFFDGTSYGSEAIAQEMYADYVSSQMTLSDYIQSENY